MTSPSGKAPINVTKNNFNVPIGQEEAGLVLGMTRGQIFFKITLLQMIKRIVPPMSNEIITGRSKKFKHRSRVVFPLPEDPIMDTTCPCSKEKLISFANDQANRPAHVQ